MILPKRMASLNKFQGNLTLLNLSGILTAMPVKKDYWILMPQVFRVPRGYLNKQASLGFTSPNCQQLISSFFCKLYFTLPSPACPHFIRASPQPPTSKQHAPYRYQQRPLECCIASHITSCRLLVFTVLSFFYVLLLNFLSLLHYFV